MYHATGAEQRDHWTKLAGAFAVLLLLGVPWIFSAFGVINPQPNTGMDYFERVVNVRIMREDIVEISDLHRSTASN